ncbi:unnamed protein product, partial [Mesorhabditis belari]|uniref:Uncharacterized protein n=1 Tax=Mesorhabditis belari TaxID=2138241 RepID=A0AAF3EF98_9BILA
MKDKEQTKTHVNIPIDEQFPCPFCNLHRCGSMGFCYILKHRLTGKEESEYCANRDEMTALVRDPLAVWASRDACQPAVTDDQIAFCWCANVSEETEEDKLRSIRIWRYQSVIERGQSAANANSGTRVLSILTKFLIFNTMYTILY